MANTPQGGKGINLNLLKYVMMTLATNKERQINEKLEEMKQAMNTPTGKTPAGGASNGGVDTADGNTNSNAPSVTQKLAIEFQQLSNEYSVTMSASSAIIAAEKAAADKAYQKIS